MAVEGGEQLLHGEFVVADVVPDVEMSETDWRVSAILGKLLAGLPDGATVFRTARADDDIGISTRGEVLVSRSGVSPAVSTATFTARPEGAVVVKTARQSFPLLSSAS